MMMLTLEINGETHEVSVDPRMPLLWVLRDVLGLTGTKYGCDTGTCGNCTVHIDGRATRACTATVQWAAGKRITTIEGLGGNHPLQLAWQAADVAQCGYCTPGQIMTAAELLATTPDPDDAQIDRAMSRVLCRCGTYPHVRDAIRRAAQALNDSDAAP